MGALKKTFSLMKVSEKNKKKTLYATGYSLTHATEGKYYYAKLNAMEDFPQLELPRWIRILELPGELWSRLDQESIPVHKEYTNLSLGFIESAYDSYEEIEDLGQMEMMAKKAILRL
ncbi:hypothetical protein N7495_005062 [Penicillium taxi]|uniref:uncharacterized protein n=1 Tax=Penicillium taxi TaxID=168475 RepID=UPI002545114C|nr:uncharacterized protein N7495_005062 [Penicillium taxi]KAJ5893371.1 hypothetical protein N7495_005062 [Penicillium taxi]